MFKLDAFVSTRTKYYGIPESSLKNKETVDPLVIEKLMVETIPRIPKGTYKRALHTTPYTIERELNRVLIFLSPNFSSYFYLCFKKGCYR